MGQVSRPLIALLVATVAFFALWIVALKPSSSTTSGSSGLGAYQSAINKAHQAVAVSAAGNAAAAGETTSTPAVTTAPATKAPAAPATSAPAATATKTRPVAKPVAAVTKPAHAITAAARLRLVSRALQTHKVLALLFYNPAAVDDNAVKQELAAVPTHRGRVVKLAVPISELSSYTAVTTQVPVNLSPTLVLVDPSGQASTIVGFADRFEIAQRVLDALAVR